MKLADFPLLALVLFTPWFAIIGSLFWLFPRMPRDARRRRFDLVSLGIAVIAFVIAVMWSFGFADPGHHLWPQVLATTVGYGVFLGVMLLAFLLRRRWLRRVTGPSTGE